MQRSTYHGYKLLLRSLLLSSIFSLLTPMVVAEEPASQARDEPSKPLISTTDEISLAPAKVDVNPVSRDEEIRKRLQNVLNVTDWFTEPQVRVEQGVVFLNGRVESAELKKWAGDLARNTQDVVAVANRMEVPAAPVMDFRPTWSGLSVLWRDFVGSLPFFAFRDITENFLASIFLSIQRPFEMGDLVEMVGVTGYVQQLNVRTTILMTLDGNLVQIPNAAVYKNNLRNFTTNSNRREDFAVGIGYADLINDAQEIARKVLADHPAVLNDPEPSVLVDSLGASTVNLRVYFWLNGREHSWLKVRSSVIRLVKLAFQKHGISMPDEAREIVFPQGFTVTLLDGQLAHVQGMPGKGLSPGSQHEELATVSTKAEAGLYSEAGVIEEQGRQAQLLNVGQNLLEPDEKQTKEP